MQHASVHTNVAIVGNKADLADARKVSSQQGQALADQYQVFRTQYKLVAMRLIAVEPGAILRNISQGKYRR
jgi:hypothetical protein